MTSACRYGKKNSNGGFTLLEVMVSLSIVAIVFVSLFKMQSSNILLAGNNKFYTTAPFLTGQTISRIQKDLDDNSNLEGDFGENFPGYLWTAEISAYQTYDSKIISETAAKRLKRVEIEIFNKESSFILTTWRYLK